MNELLGILLALPLAALITLLILSLFLLSLGWRTTVDSQGVFVLRYSLPLRIFAVLGGFVCPVGLMLLVLVIPPRRPEDTVAAAAGVVGFKLLGWVVLRGCFQFRVVVSPHGLVCSSPWRRVLAMDWGEVVEVRSECPRSWFVFLAADRRRIDVPLSVAGLASLVAAIRTHLPAAVYAPAVAGFRLATRESEEDLASEALTSE
jgi:hypothetical protein